MRYRPFGRSGTVVSAVSLALGDAAAERGANHVRELVWAALEDGINSYHLTGSHPALPAMVGEALSSVERRLVFVSMRLGVVRGPQGIARDFSPEAMTAAVDHVITSSGLEHVDLAVLDNPSTEEFPTRALSALKALRAVGKVRLLGVAGDNDAMDAYVSTNAFDVLSTPYHLRSGWKERNRLKAAVELDMGVVAYGWFPDSLSTARKVEALTAAAQPVRRGLFGGARPAATVQADPLAGVGGYAFLHQTKNWTAEEICLAYALTETAVASVMVEATDADRLRKLAAVPERDLPPGLAAQIEMARFSPEPG